MKTHLFLLTAAVSAVFFSCGRDRSAEPLRIKVAVVYEDPVLPSTGQRVHECCTTPGYDYRWNDPKAQTVMFADAINEASHGAVEYEIVEMIDADTLFTVMRDDPERKHVSVEQLDGLLHLDSWGVSLERNIYYDYASMVKHYGFDRKRDAGEIDEVWIYSTPLSGAYESHMMGKGAFWVNSPGEEDCTCNELLTVMFFNYERNLACALESFSHRVESVMMKVYGWWNYEGHSTKDELTTWERYTGYAKIYSKYDDGKSNVGNVHFPPNGTHDYDFLNEDYVLSYADEWLDYPEVPEKQARRINCSEWSTHEGYMRWWLGHIPHFRGISPYDGKLNNWWHYVMDYKEAVELEERLDTK